MNAVNDWNTEVERLVIESVDYPVAVEDMKRSQDTDPRHEEGTWAVQYVDDETGATAYCVVQDLEVNHDFTEQDYEDA